MSTLKVEVVTIDEILPHPHADRLELATVCGWVCVVQKGAFKPKDKVIYIPIDSVLSEATEALIFSPDSKVKLHHRRVKTIRLRKAISQGLVVSLALVKIDENTPVGTDVADKLGITKYEPPARGTQFKGNAVPRKKLHPDFHKYTDIENFKHYPNLFAEGEQIICSEKIHGSNFRCALLPSYAGSLWKKILKFFHLLPKYEFVFGSHNVQMQNKLFTGDTPTNIYAEMVRKYALEAILKPGEAVYGEIYGGGIQKNYTYGCGENEHKLAIFDVMIDGKYLDQIAAQNWCKARDLPFVRILYIGPFKREVVNDLCKGDSKFEPSQKVIEGVVIKPLQETTCHVGRKVLKFINDEYLLGDQSDYH